MAEPPGNRYDFIAIGCGPAGQRAAVQAAKEGRRTALVDRRPRSGGVSLHFGTVPSKTLREAVLFFTGFLQREIYGLQPPPAGQVTLADLFARVEKVLTHEMTVVDNQLLRNKVDMICGEASFLDARRIEVRHLADGTSCVLEADHFVIATGTQPRWPATIPFDQEVVFDSNFIFSTRNKRKELPRSLLVVGGGVIGTEYACIFNALGCEVTILDAHHEILGFLDREICGHLLEEMRREGVRLVFGEEYLSIRRTPDRRGRVETRSGRIFEADAVLFAIGRSPFVGPLHLERTQVRTGPQGLIAVDEHYRTAEPSIYAAGDVIGYPALASTSSEQGRAAARHALGLPVHPHPPILPFAIYTIPEIATVGKTEEQLLEEGIPYEKGLAPYSELGKAAIIGNTSGALKLLFHRDTRRLLGAHILGDLASELIHIPLIAMSLGAGIDVFLDNVFNSPTLSEIFKVAALNGINRLEGKAFSPVI